MVLCYVGLDALVNITYIVYIVVCSSYGNMLYVQVPLAEWVWCFMHVFHGCFLPMYASIVLRGPLGGLSVCALLLGALGSRLMLAGLCSCALSWSRLFLHTQKIFSGAYTICAPSSRTLGVNDACRCWSSCQHFSDSVDGFCDSQLEQFHHAQQALRAITMIRRKEGHNMTRPNVFDIHSRN
jgi:hypothetical protein